MAKSAEFDINKAPAEFVVVRGQTYKMSKATPPSGVIRTDFINPRSSPEIGAFKDALENAEAIMTKQTSELKKKDERNRELEQFIMQNADKLGGVNALKDLGLESISLKDGDNNNNSKPRLGLAARRRADAQKSGVYELNLNTQQGDGNTTTSSDTPSVSAHSELNDTVSSQLGKQQDEISPISVSNNYSYSHDLITPVANVDAGAVVTPAASAARATAGFDGVGGDGGATFSEGSTKSEHDITSVRASPPTIRRSHSDGNGFSPVPAPLSDEDNNRGGELSTNSSSSSLSRSMAATGKQERKDKQHARQAEVLTIGGEAAAGDSSNKSNPSPSRGPPKGLAARLSMGSQERRKLNEKRRANNASSENLRAITGEQFHQQQQTPSSSSSSSSSRERTPSSAGSDQGGMMDMPGSRASSANSHRGGTAPSSSSISSSAATFTGSPYKWNNNDDVPVLFVAHDNPQLGSNVATSLRKGGDAGAGRNGMGFMLESKDESGLTVFITGSISYSGPFEGIESSTLDGEMARGSQCLAGVGLRGYRVNMKTVTTRPRGELIEMDLHPEKKDKSDNGKTSPAKVLAETAVTFFALDDKDALRALLKTCKSRVDIILDPYHTDNKWFPYWEGRRKMAPQFRSKGVGYLRLGDDMSNYGSAFLSLDAGATYMDDGASGAIVSNASTPVNGASGGNSSHNWGTYSRGSSGGSGSRGGSAGSHGDSFYSTGGRQIEGVTPSHSAGSSRGRSTPGDSDGTPYADGGSSRGGGSAGSGTGIALIHEFRGMIEEAPGSPAEAVEKEEELKELIAQLRDPDLKWADRTQCLQRLSEMGVSCAGASETYANAATGGTGAVETANSAAGDKVVMDTIGVLRDTLMKQNNPHVRKSALRCLPTISQDIRHRASCAVAWKSLLLESIHMIRTINKVMEEAREALDFLHSAGSNDRKQPCLSLHQLSGHFEEIILGPRGKGAAGKSASNTCKVIQWVQSMCSTELEASITALATLRSSSFKPSVYERVDIGLLLKKCKTTFQHREEATREAMAQLGAILITMDVLQVIADSSAFAALAAVVLKEGGDNHEATLIKAMSSSCTSGMQEMKKAAPRLYAKVIEGAARQVQTSAQVLEAAEATEAEAAGNSNRQSPPLHGSSRGNSSSGSDRFYVGSRASSRGGGVSSASGSGAAATRRLGSGSSATKTSTPRTPSSSEKQQQREQPLPPSSASSISRSPEQQQKQQDQQQPSSASATTPSAAATGDAAVAYQQSLSDSWYETRLMLRILPTTSSSWNNLVSVAAGCTGFVADLESAAGKVEPAVPRAGMLRAVLPFDESTSSNDQSKIASPNAKAEGILSQLSKREVDSLRERAVSLRKVVRIKMADEADLRQAIEATKMLHSFCTKVDKLSAMTSKSAVDIIKELETVG
jgi:hypothetical protein